MTENKLYMECVCCGAPIAPETGFMICPRCAEKLESAELHLAPLNSSVIGFPPIKSESRIFKKEFSRVKKAITKAACSGRTYVKIYVRDLVADEILARLKKDGFKATQPGFDYDSPLFITW